MMLWFEFKGKSSMEFRSIVVQELPDIIRAGMRVKKTEIEGRDGVIYDEIGLENITKTILVGLKNTTEIDDINAWLIGEGDLVLSNEETKLYKAKIVEALSWGREGRFRTGKIKAICEPYKYKRYEENIVVTNPEEVVVNNEGNTECKPLMVITGTGTITVLIDDSECFTITTGETESIVEIDSEEEDCKINGDVNNRIINGKFPAFGVGTHTLTFQGGTVTEIDIKTRSRWR